MKTKAKKSLFFIVSVIIVAFLIGAYPMAYLSSQEDVNITVTKSERVTSGDNSYYLIYTDSETFENTDSWLFIKFDSSDLYRELKVGEKYNVKVVGWRIPFFSLYRNIIKINKLETE